MAIRVVCACGKEINVKDELAGKKIRCPACQMVVAVPQAGPSEAPMAAEVIEDDPPPRPVRRLEAVDDDDRYDDDDEFRRGRRKKKKKQGSSVLLFVGLGAGVLVLGFCCIGLGVGGYFLFKPRVLTPPFDETGRWASYDSTVTVPSPFMQGPRQIKAPYKAYKVQLKAGKTYIFDLTRNVVGLTNVQPDPYLILEDATGMKLVEDDDAGGNLNARIVFKATQDGEFRILAASINGYGDFTLKAREK
jgi:hypothetical protein